MSNILFEIVTPPYSSPNSDEIHDLIMASTAYGHDAAVLISPSAISHLFKQQSVPEGYKNTAKRLSGYELFDVSPIYVPQVIFDDMHLAFLPDDIKSVSDDEIDKLKQEAKFVITL